MSEAIEIDHLRTWIGKQDRATDTITPELQKRVVATLGGYTELGSQLPLGIHWCLAVPAVTHDHLGIDGHPVKGGFLPPVPLPRRMWASSRMRFYKPAGAGDCIDRTSTIADVVLKQSAASGQLVFVHIDHVYTHNTEHVENTLLEERQTIVYREPAEFEQAAPQQQRNPPAHSLPSLSIRPDSTLLFRYSAVTFNSHRIHYDHHYATGEEGYPGLVVQGPLMATLLMNLAQARRPNNPLREFEFQGVAPAFADQTLVLSVEKTAVAKKHRGEVLEARNHQGALVMTARAQFGDDDGC